ncbi:TerC family protein [Pseudomonas sp. NFR16]|uniref:TerC family protein n=1 Tax=Pseudomonas sp. NFR16 TaxID=1566248 RepID=UPI0008BB5555|nr:TerC family protein [Pseudomonas sp. NFR16]SEJ80728.1 integral membrane protein, YjbE family [Pseudomonas sp. NFR16]
MAWLQDPFIWTALAQIVLIDLLLGGDNAVIIAMACRRLPRELQTRAIYGGMLGAVLLRIVMLFFAVHLLALPFLKLIGAALLLWIGIKLAANQEEGEEQIDGGTQLWTAIKTVIVADVVMSLDNVLAVAAAGNGNVYLVAAGVVVSIPIIVIGSRFVLAVMARFSWLVIAGGGLIGWIAGGMAVSDPSLQPYLPDAAWLHWAASGIAAVLVVLTGIGLGRRSQRNVEQAKGDPERT